MRGQLEWKEEQEKSHGRDKTVRSQQLPELGFKRRGEGRSLKKGSMVGGADFHPGQDDFRFPMRFRRRAQQTAAKVAGERPGKDWRQPQRGES